VQQRVSGKQIGLCEMAKRVLDRAFEIGACQQPYASQAERRGISRQNFYLPGGSAVNRASLAAKQTTP